MELGRWFHQLEGDFLFWWDIEPPELCSGHSFWHKLYSITRTSKTTLFRHNHQEKFLQISSLTSVGPFAHYGRWEIPRAALFVVQLLSCAQLFANPWAATHQAFLSFTVSLCLLKLMSIELVVLSNLSSCVADFSSCLQSFPASTSFTMSQFFALGSQSIETSALASVLPMNIQGWLAWSPCSPRDSKESSPTHSSKASILWHSAFSMVQLSHPYMTTGKTIALTIHTLVSKVISLLFNTLSRLVKSSLPRGKCLLILWLQSLSTVILEPKKIMKLKSFCKSGLFSLAIQ